VSSIPFHKIAISREEERYVLDALRSGNIQADGPYTRACEQHLHEHIGGVSLLTHSCTAALEMAVILAGVGPGDEVIMPSFTFVSTANAVVLAGGVPVFVDVRADTLNIDESLIESAITSKTRAIIAVHYAGVCAEMDSINQIARHHDLVVIEDAAQALQSFYHGRPAGSLGTLACFSFHETKNITCGEGGALLVNDASFGERARLIRDKGTNRFAFENGLVDKYSWVDKGSSYAPSDILAALLLFQLERCESITRDRKFQCERYAAALQPLTASGVLRLGIVPDECESNGHMLYVRFTDHRTRDDYIEWMRSHRIVTPFHFVPLHSSKAGKKWGRTGSSMDVTDTCSRQLARLPLYAGMGSEVEVITGLTQAFFKDPMAVSGRRRVGMTH